MILKGMHSLHKLHHVSHGHDRARKKVCLKSSWCQFCYSHPDIKGTTAAEKKTQHEEDKTLGVEPVERMELMSVSGAGTVHLFVHDNKLA